MRRDERIAKEAKTQLHQTRPWTTWPPHWSKPPPESPYAQYYTAPPQLSQLPPEVAHSPQPPAASAPLDSAPGSTASVPSHTLATLAASEESGGWPEGSRTIVVDCESDESIEDDPPQKNPNVCKKDTGRCLRTLLSSDVYPATTVSHFATRRRGPTRTLSCSLAMFSWQTSCVALCMFQVHTPSVPRGISREPPPPHPVLKPSHCRTMGSRSSTTTKRSFSELCKVTKSYKRHGPSNSFHLAGAPPHYFHGFKVGHTTPESRSSPNVMPLRESPCISPTAPTRYNTTPSPRTDLSDTIEVWPAGGCGLVLAPKFKWR